MVRAASLLAELVGVAALPFAGWTCEGRRHGEFQETMGNLDHGYYVSTNQPVCEGEQTKLFKGCFIRDMPKPFHEPQSELLHLSNASASRDRMGWVA